MVKRVLFAIAALLACSLNAHAQYLGWTATFKSYDRESNVVHVDFVNGGTTIHQTFTPSGGLSTLTQAAAWIKGEARSTIQRFVTQTTLIAAPANTGVTPSADPAPDADQATIDQFATNAALLYKLRTAVDIGLVAANDPQLTALIANMQSQFNALTTQQKLKVINILPIR